MIILEALTARPVVGGNWTEPRGVINGLHHEVKEGVFLHVTLGAAGLVIRHGEAQVAIPLDSLVNLAQKHDPRIGAVDLLPAAKPTVPAVGRDSVEP